MLSQCGYTPNHCVQVVGVDTKEGYYKIRNSWGESWGDDGYIYLTTGRNTCGIEIGTPQYTKVTQT